MSCSLGHSPCGIQRAVDLREEIRRRETLQLYVIFPIGNHLLSIHDTIVAPRDIGGRVQ
jgi:hypothetical protein